MCDVYACICVGVYVCAKVLVYMCPCLQRSETDTGIALGTFCFYIQDIFLNSSAIGDCHTCLGIYTGARNENLGPQEVRQMLSIKLSS